MATIHIGRGASTLGAFPEAQVREGLANGRFHPTDLGWREGMENWRPLAEFPEFAAVISQAQAAAETASPSLQRPSPPETGATASEERQPPAASPPASESADSSTAAPGSEPAQPLPPTTAAPPQAPGLPWDHRAVFGIPSAFFQTLQMVLTEPSRAFVVMRRHASFNAPFLYALIGTCLGGFIALLYQFALSTFGGLGAAQGGSDALGAFGIQTGASLLLGMFFVPVFASIGLIIWSGILHLCLLLVGGANETFNTTFSVVCYSFGSTALLQVVPGCGSVIGFIWSLVALTIGFTKAHSITTGRALLAVFLPLIVCCGTMLLFGVAVGAFTRLSGASL